MRLAAKKNQRGDTIVEVLISILVVSVVLVTAYVTTNHNINSMQDTQEHSEALQIAQAQLEYLHNVPQSGRPNGGCFDASTGHKTSGVSCSVDSSGSNSSSQQHIFSVDISLLAGGVSYKVDVQWPGIQAGQTNHVDLFYQP
jgi:Tfp pilus assembly protein PilV